MFLSSLLIGVPVRPKKNALGRAMRMRAPKSPSWVRWASSTMTMILSRKLIASVILANSKIFVMITFRVSALSSLVSSALVSAGTRFGTSAMENVPKICPLRSIRSLTMITVGALSSFIMRSFWAAKTISRDLPLPWKCQIRPFLG